MVPAEAVQGAARAQIEQEAAQRRLAELSTEAQTSSEAQIEEKTDEAIKAALPEEVVSAVGRLPYSKFKERYRSVYDQVFSKEYLLTGRVTHDQPLAGTTFTLRSLKSRERNALAALQTQSDFVSSQYTRAALAAGLAAIGDKEYPAVKLEVGGYDAWAANPAVKALLEWIDEADETLVDYLMGVHMDISLAKTFALREDLKNH